MSTHDHPEDNLPLSDPPPAGAEERQDLKKTPSGHPLAHAFAWIAVLILVGLSVLGNMLGSEASSSEAEETELLVPQISAADEMNGRMILGLGELASRDSYGPMILNQAAPMRETGTPIQRLAYVIMVSDLESPEAAIEALEKLNTSVDAGELGTLPVWYPQMSAIVGELLFDIAAEEPDVSLPEDERTMLMRGLGIYGELLYADATGDDALTESLQSQFSRAAVTLMCVMVWFLGMGGIGFVLLVLMFVLRMMKKLEFSFTPGSGAGSIYIETFAIWLFLFMGLSFVLPVLCMFGLWVSGLDEYMSIEELLSGVTPLAIGLATMFLSLGALLWPVLRGVDFKTVRQDIGLVAGRPVQEILAGFATYAAALPMLLVGVLIYAVLSFIVVAIAGEQPEPSHPIQNAFSSGPWGLLLIYLVACVAAPIVEEIMFRGVLYRYLRDLSRGWSWFLSFAMTALISSFIFAIIHPQGVLFVPILGALAVGFCLGREWRGSLIAPMVAHSISNTVVVTLGMMIS